jgi:hypothetical protein
MKGKHMDQTQQTESRKAYAEPTLQEREHVDEVVWGTLATTTTGVIGA